MTMLAAACCTLLMGSSIGGNNFVARASDSSNSRQTGLATLLQTAPSVVEPARLEITPALEGKIENEEWDPFSSGPDSKTFLQWEPGSIFVAGVGPAGSDLLVSLDLGSNGWLVGSDNVEARVRLNELGQATISVRRLNAKNMAGPVWEELPGWALASVAKATQQNGRISYELRLNDAGLNVLPRKSAKIGGRVDLIPSQEPSISPNQPRVLAPLSLVTTRAEGLPSTLRYEVEGSQFGVPGALCMVRFDFSTAKAQPQPPAKKIEISGEGLMKNKMANLSSPFPNFGGKKRGFVDYSTKISDNAETGFHVLKAVLTLSDDTPATVESSFYVAPVVDIEVDHARIPSASVDRSVGVGMSIRSNVRQPLRALISFAVNPKFKLLNRSDTQDRVLLEPRARVNRKFTLYVPGNTKGTYPIEFTVDAGGVKSKITRFVTFD